MQYRDFGSTGKKVSALGFGAMRLPLLEDGKIDEATTITMIRRAIDQGLNYVDTAYPYHGGESERVVGKALRDGYREKTFLADKCPVWKLEKEEDFHQVLDEQLDKLGTDHVDFYLLHALGRERFEEKVKKLNLVKAMERARDEGKIRYLGFSFHDEYQVFQDIVDYYGGWDFCQIQYNYIDLNHQAGLKGLRYAASKGMGVVVMEPLLGGRLANLESHVAEVFPPGKSCVEYALDFLWDQKEVSLVLSGMSHPKQVADNLLYAARGRVGMATGQDRETWRKAKEVFDSMALVGCTGCNYCMPCPFGLDIPQIFSLYNQTAGHQEEDAKKAYQALAAQADACQACRSCEEECPQGIKVSEMMPRVSDTFAKL